MRVVGPDRLAERARRAPARAGGTRVVCVDGPAGGGKTTLAEWLADAMGGCQVVHMDDLYPGWEGLADAVPLLVKQVLAPLSEGRPGRFRQWDWTANRWGARPVEVPVTDVLVVEGVGCGSRAPAAYASLLVWVEADREERFRRGIERDGETFRPHWERWAAQEEALFAVEGTRDRADVIVDGGQDRPPRSRTHAG